jgi:hypothetical protein
MTYVFKNNYIIYIRSNEVTQISEGFNTNMQVTLATNSITVNDNQQFRLSLHSANIPNNIYNVSKSTLNNFIIINGTSHLIPAGFYSIYTLIDYLNDLSLGLSFEFIDTQSHVKITNTSVSTITLNFSSTLPNSKGFCKLIGFTEVDRNISASGSTTGTLTVNMTSVKTIYVYSSLSVTNAVTTQSNNFQNIIATVPITGAARDIIFFREDSKNFTNILNDTKINNFTIELRDQQSRLIQLNDTNFDLTFLLEIFEKDVIVTENRRAIEQDVPQFVGTPTPIDTQFTLDDMLESANDIQQPVNPIPPPIQQIPVNPIPVNPIPVNPTPVQIPVNPTPVNRPHFSDHNLADVLLKAQVLKLKNII